LITPELIVFDLDFTLWDCGGNWCDCLSPPFQARAEKITDRNGRSIRLYEDVPTIFEQCDRDGVAMAVASRTEQPEWARDLLNLLEITTRFEFSEIYPSSKLRHFAALQSASGIDYEKMLFFDDELRNIDEVSRLGVRCVHVPAGLDGELFQDARQRFADK